MVRSLLSGKSDNNCMSSREMLQVNSSKSNNNLLLCDPVRPDFHDLKKWIQSKFLIMIFFNNCSYFASQFNQILPKII